MSTTATICNHAPYFDMDEWRCRTCGRSLTFPTLTPQEHRAEEKQRPAAPSTLLRGTFAPERESVVAPVSCVRCHRRGTFSEDGDGSVYCALDKLDIAVTHPNGDLRLPDFDPSRLLRCSCCSMDLPQFCFSRNARAAHREFRNAQCRGCMAFRQRVRREEQGDHMRAESRRRAEEVKRKREAGELPPMQTTATRREAVNAAGRRRNARNAGRSVPKRRAGAPVLLIKPICRIRDTCPLASYCVDKAPSDKPSPVSVHK